MILIVNLQYMDPIYGLMKILYSILHVKLFENTVHNIFVGFTNYIVFFAGLFLF